MGDKYNKGEFVINALVKESHAPEFETFLKWLKRFPFKNK